MFITKQFFITSLIRNDTRDPCSRIPQKHQRLEPLKRPCKALKIDSTSFNSQSKADAELPENKQPYNTNIAKPPSDPQKTPKTPRSCFLTPDLKVPGVTNNLSNSIITGLSNSKGVYALRCIVTNMHYVGESKDIKFRLAKHRRL